MKKTKKIHVTLNEDGITRLEEITKKGGFLSAAEAMRHCINNEHKRMFPYYKVVAETKEEEDNKHKELLALPPEEYAVKVLEADIETEPGACILQHRQKPWKGSIALSEMKNYKSRNDFWQQRGIPPET